MLSNNTFLETRIQRLIDSLFLSIKTWCARAAHAWVGVYILAEILCNLKTFEKKNEEKFGTLFTIMIWQINDLVQTNL